MNPKPFHFGLLWPSGPSSWPFGPSSWPFGPSSWLLGLYTGFLDPAGPRFRAFGSGAWLLSWVSSGLWGLDSPPPGSLSLGARFPPGSLPIRAPRTKKVAIYGLALNPKRWKVGWLACRTAEWGEKKRCWPRSWDNVSKANTHHHPPPGYAATPTPFRCVGGAIHA